LREFAGRHPPAFGDEPGAFALGRGHPHRTRHRFMEADDRGRQFAMQAVGFGRFIRAWSGHCIYLTAKILMRYIICI